MLPTSFLNTATWDVLVTAPQRFERAFSELEPHHAPLFLAVTPPGGRVGCCHENVAQTGVAPSDPPRFLQISKSRTWGHGFVILWRLDIIFRSYPHIIFP
jgi:hypothetical protein